MINIPTCLGDQHTRKIMTLSVPPWSRVYEPFAHYDCVCNQVVSIRNRVLGKVPEMTNYGKEIMWRGAAYIKRSLPQTQQEEIGAFALQYSGAKRTKYLKASYEVQQFGISKRDAGVTMFVKTEKMDPLAKVNPDPRAVQFRDPRYCALLASYLKPIEHHLYALKIQHKNLGNTRLVGKGLNQVERATLLMRKMDRFRRPCVVSLDASRFDQHIGIEALKCEHSVYTHCCQDPELARILSWQLNNKCRTKQGTKYVTRGKRMSGDMNTALGNCVIMISCIVGIMEEFDIMYDILDDGDDCLLIVEEVSLALVQARLPALFLECGHEIKLENVAFSVPEVSWCQSNPIHTSQGWKFVRNPIKVLSTCLVGLRWLHVPEHVRRRYLAGLGECELVLNAGVPILQEFALALVRNSHGAEALFDQSGGEWFRMLRESRLYRSRQMSLDISWEARDTFALAFGVSIQEQMEVEANLRLWDINCGGEYFKPGGWDPKTWTIIDS